MTPGFVEHRETEVVVLQNGMAGGCALFEFVSARMATLLDFFPLLCARRSPQIPPQ